MNKQHHQTKAEDRISFGQKSAYAVGMLVNNLQAAALPAMVVILNLGLGMDVMLVGLIVSIPRIFDAISDPMVGYISDHTHTRWGRRRPFIFIGALLAGLIFALMWQVPSGYIDILGKTPVQHHEIVYQEKTKAEWNDSKGIELEYQSDQNSDATFILYGPELHSERVGSVISTNLEGFPQIELNVSLPEYETMEIIFREALSENGESGFSYHIELQEEDSQEGKGNLYKFSISDLSLLSLGADIEGHMIYPDHYGYRQKDIDMIAERCYVAGADKVVTTAKDLVKIRELDISALEGKLIVLDVRIEITEGKENLIAGLNSVFRADRA